ncbi:MAG: VWA domain-containing protein [Acidobacteriota bacterium]
MTPRKLTRLAVGALLLNTAVVSAQAPPVASFKASVDLVRITAVVRDHKGRLVQDLSAGDFEILESGAFTRKITDFRADLASVNVALLFDVSGSMESRLGDARETAAHVLGWLNNEFDEAAVYTFDTELIEIAPFTVGLKGLPAAMASVRAFGETSLRDAIGQAAKRLGERDGRRRALVVLTDGRDTSSRLSAEEVSGIASATDVPVYIIGIVPSIDNPEADAATPSADKPWQAGSLDSLAMHTGGLVFKASTPGQRRLAARQIVDELRHQYLIAFESSGNPGWHPLQVRTRDRALTVRARAGYTVGQSRPHSF